jgi:hypothetical protein
VGPLRLVDAFAMSEVLSFKRTLGLAQTECRVKIALLPVSRAPGQPALPGASGCERDTTATRRRVNHTPVVPNAHC